MSDELSLSEEYSKRPGERLQILLPWVLGAAFFLLAILSMRHMTLTYDEDHIYAYGTRILHLNSDRNNPSVMPIVALNALPKRVAGYLPNGYLHFLLSKFPAARLVTLSFGLGLAALVYRWSRQLYGGMAALFSLAMFAFEPNLLAHARLVTTDLYISLGFALTAYCAWRYSRKEGAVALLGLGLALGYANITKYSAVLLYPTVLLLLLLPVSQDLASAIAVRRWRRLFDPLFRIAGRFVLVAAISVLIINLFFLFNGTLTPLSEYAFKSGPFQSLQQSILRAADPPIPYPAPYLEGLDTVLQNERTARDGVAKFYLFGELNNSGFRGYYLIASLFKVPLGFQLLFILALAGLFVRARGRPALQDELFLLLPLLVLTVYFNGINRFTKGLRHFLPVFPLAIVFVGSLFSRWGEYSKRRKRLLLLALFWGVGSSLSYFPHFIPYFNEFVPVRRFAYRILADSNLDWGQADWYLDRYLQDHPEVIVAPDEPTPGRIVVGANELLGIIGDPQDYAWLRDNFEPVDTIAYSFLIFEVPPDKLIDIR